MRCAFDGCSCKFTPVKPNQIYCKCPEHNCYTKAAAKRRRIKPRQVTCPCGRTFETTNAATKYCHGPEYDCAQRYRREYHRRRDSGPELIDEPVEYRVLPIKRVPDGYTVIIVGDLHFPFHDGPTLQCVERFWDKFRPDLEIYNGDIFDLYSISTFDKNPSRRFSLQDEIDMTVGWLGKRAKKNPNARRIFGEGNHEDRLRKWLWRNGPEFKSLRSLAVEEQFGLKDMGFEHVNYRSRIDLLGVLIEHGWRASKSDTAYPMNVAKIMAQTTNSSGVCNHSHGLNTYRWRDARGSHSYREAGCLCRMNLEYAPFPRTWAWGFVYGVVHRNKLHLTTVPIYDDGFRAEGEFYARSV